MAPTRPYAFELTGGELCLDFANTVDRRGDPRGRRDHLTSCADLAAWSRQAAIVTPGEERAMISAAAVQPKKAAAVLDRGVRLREAVYAVFSARASGQATPKDALARLNAVLGAALSHAAVVGAGDEYRWTWRARPADALEKPLWAVAKSAADLLTSDRLTALRQCAADTCGWLFLDTSRNQSRRWCDMKVCGNREKARRFYRRRVVGQAGSPVR